MDKDVKMKAATFYYENTESTRNLPESFSCYVSDELYEILQKHNEEQGCLIELENGSQIYLGNEADKTEPNKNSDFSFIEDENTLLSIVSYALALKDFIFKNFSAADLSLSNYNHPVEAYPNPEENTTYFNFPIGNGLFFENINAEDFNFKILPKITDSCYEHVAHEYLLQTFNISGNLSKVPLKDIYHDYMENIRFFTEYRQKFLNETVKEIFHNQDISPLFNNVKVPETFSEETLNQIFFSIKNDYKNFLVKEPFSLDQFDLQLMEDFTFNLNRNEMEPLNLLPNELIEAGIYARTIDESFTELSAWISTYRADGKLDPSLTEEYEQNLQTAFDDLMDLEDFASHLQQNEYAPEFAANDLKEHFIELLKDEKLDVSLFNTETVSKGIKR